MLDTRFLAAILLAVTANGWAASLPDPFVATYELRSRGSTFGRTELTLSLDGDERYVYESRSAATGLFALIRKEVVVERSEWRRERDELRSLSYQYRRTGGKKDKLVSVSFDWSNGTATNTVRGRTWRMPVPDGTLDKLNYFLAMMRDLEIGKPEIRYKVADGGKLKDYVFERLGEETLDTALGRLEAVKLKRVRKDGKRETIVWSAKALRYLPVQVMHREKDGTVVTSYISSVDGLTTRLSAN